MDLLDAILQNDFEAAAPALAAWGARRPEAAFDNLRRILSTVHPPDFAPLYAILSVCAPENPDLDRALNNLERFEQVTTGPLRPTSLARDRPFLLDLLFDLFGFSQFMSDVLLRYPQHAAWLGEPETLRESLEAEALAAHLRSILAPMPSAELRQHAAIRWMRQRLLQASARVRRALSDESQFMREISAIADAAIRVGLEEAERPMRARYGVPIEESGEGGLGDREAGLAVLAMGKLGGEELNFSSDIDLIFIYSAEGKTTGAGGRGAPSGVITNHEYFCRLAEKLVGFLTETTIEGSLYRVDVRLRPDGAEGPLAISLGAFEIYHETQARPWERMALVKARGAAGPPELIRQLEAATRGIAYERAAAPGLIRHVRELKDRIDAGVAGGPSAGREIKRGPGGIREIEFWIQAHQLLHGAGRPELQARSTEGALAALAGRGLIAAEEAAALREDYLFLRKLEHRLQMMDLRQTHTLPADAGELDLLARRMAPAGPPPEACGAELLARWREVSGRVHRRYLEFFGEAEAEAAGSAGELSPEERAARALLGGAKEKELIPLLAPFGLEAAPAMETLRALGGMSRAFYIDARAREIFARILPRLLGAAARAARPLVALQRLESFMAASGSYLSLYEIFEARPSVPALMLKVFGLADSVAQTLVAHPEYIDYLLDPEAIAEAPSPKALAARLARWADPKLGDAEFSAGLARAKRFEFAMAAVAEIAGLATFEETTARLSLAADSILAHALARAAGSAIAAQALPSAQTNSKKRDSDLGAGFEPASDPSNPAPGFAVLAMGKLGTRELNYFSDLDLIYCYEDAGPGALAGGDAAATALAQSVQESLTAATEDGIPFVVDARLRPEGASAPLAPAISRYLEYYGARADLWEFQSLTKIRFVAGDAALAARLIAGAARVAGARIAALDRAEVARQFVEMRGAIERSAKIPSWVLCDFKKGPGGVVDLEFIAQFWLLGQLAKFSPSAPQDTANLFALRADAVFALMSAAGDLDPASARAMSDDYLFLRRFEARSRLLFGTEKSHVPSGGEKWENLERATRELLAADAELRAVLVETLQRNRKRFELCLRA